MRKAPRVSNTWKVTSSLAISRAAGAQGKVMRLHSRITLPCAPAAREIAKEDVTFQVFETLGAFRLLAHRYETMPQWCRYRGAEHVFPMAGRLILRPD